MNRRQTIKHRLISVVAATVLSVSAVQPAHALFGVGDIVIDPSNLAQNILTAARTLEMINNQIQQLQNEATMLVNQARNLQGLDFDALNRLRTTLAATQRLFDEARGLAFEVSQMQGQLERLYPFVYDATVSRARMNSDRLEHWANEREALGTALMVQSQATENFEADQSVLSDLVARSQSAVGILQATQATNQLLALQARELMQAQQLEIAQGRAGAVEQARIFAAQGRSNELRRRFMTTTTTYTPEPVRGF
jgi:P-type conjugative transfer protein TrbJ